MYTGIILTFIALGYQAFNAGGSELVGVNEEEDHTVYNYSWFHFVFVMAFMYMTAILTDWMTISVINNEWVTTSDSFTQMWIKASTSWVCMALYIWTLVAPLVFPNRDFGV